MSDLRFLALSGSLRRESHNTALLHALARRAPAGVTVEVHEGLGELPYFNQDREDVPPASVVDLRNRVREADGLVIATPEYNSAIPGVLMNALDWLSRPAGDSSLLGKATAILGASPSQFGTARGQLVLRQILHRVQAPVVAHPEVTVFRSHQRFDADGTFLADEFTESLLRELLRELVHLAQHTRARAELELAEPSAV
ncbi:NAD(P)H-dependent oxidoreductase [Streptomyces sp. NBC_00237]|uniref:NADPH-dependent FMN reductase n=1 Tax=Streptomyces sp. NBC_00237 TaxID=2975687 RepID=UPI0022525604|nr:NADPH-dependent FMN reductase [Streptomyces sp. NBC_00237]MCX5205516.1 NAD(P)H-dependent oxidoreductase [Streptomyces sp. NBC_00237]